MVVSKTVPYPWLAWPRAGCWDAVLIWLLCERRTGDRVEPDAKENDDLREEESIDIVDATDGDLIELPLRFSGP